jgi:hypothetical protein
MVQVQFFPVEPVHLAVGYEGRPSSCQERLVSRDEVEHEKAAPHRERDLGFVGRIRQVAGFVLTGGQAAEGNDLQIPQKDSAGRLQLEVPARGAEGI